MKTFLQAEFGRKAEHFNAESGTETEKLRSLLSSCGHWSPSVICLQPKREEGKSLLCYVHLHHFHPPIRPLHSFLHPPTLGCGRRSSCPLWSGDVEDGADAQEEAPEDGPQFRDQVELHHFTQLGVVAGSMGLELEIKNEKNVN